MKKTLDQLECDRRSKELDAREQYLIEREALLEEAPVTIKVLNETIKAKKHQLYLAEKKVEAANTSYSVQVLEYRGNLADFDEQRQSVSDTILELESKKTQIVTENSDLQKKGKSLKKEVVDSRTYKAEQDRLIQETINEGNVSLKALKYEVDNLGEIKNCINYEIAILKSTQQEVEDSIHKHEQQLNDLEKAYADTKKLLNKSLAEIKASIKANMIRNKQVTDDTQKKLAILKLKEEEILAKRQALRKERVELDTEKRRWDSQKTLYDV